DVAGFLPALEDGYDPPIQYSTRSVGLQSSSKKRKHSEGNEQEYGPVVMRTKDELLKLSEEKSVHEICIPNDIQYVRECERIGIETVKAGADSVKIDVWRKVVTGDSDSICAADVVDISCGYVHTAPDLQNMTSSWPVVVTQVYKRKSTQTIL